MCGIAGLIARQVAVVRDAVNAMSQAQLHRGPDDGGDAFIPFGDRQLGLGFRRLSILDLSPGGHQPMTHRESGNTLIFNGEIYNFKALRAELEQMGEKFDSSGDTAVLLAALTRWGKDALPKLQGMFAIAFHNARDRTLMLARDAIGIKPLYVASIDGAIVFASEVRAILASGLVPRDIDRQAVAELLAYGAVQQPSTMFKHIRSFPPGCMQLIRADSAGPADKPVKCWKYPTPTSPITLNEAVGSTEKILDSAVADHLVSDVPVGVFLSSGLDSTIIAALAARHSSRMRSFTVGFADQPDFSELTLARETAGLFGLNHTEIQINGSDAESEALQWMQSLDQPSVDGLNVFVISKAVKAQGITVALSGQGGDELFGGYPSFTDVPKLLRLMRWVRWMPVSLRLAICSLTGVAQSEAVQQKMRDVLRSGGSVLDLYFHRRRAMSDGQLAKMGVAPMTLGLDSHFQPPGALDGMALDEHDVLASISELESRFYQGNMLLRDGDANSMAHSLEVRVPMLDQRMLDFMLKVPGNVRLPEGIGNKHLLRVAFAPFLRPALLKQSKRGFQLPIGRWMFGPLRDLCEHAIVSLKSFGILEARGIDNVWNGFLAEPESPVWSRAFTLCVLGIYLRRNKALV